MLKVRVIKTLLNDFKTTLSLGSSDLEHKSELVHSELNP